MEANTHLAIDRSLCGAPVALEPGFAVVELATTQPMCADARGLVHGGFVFGAADYAAMLAVNDPNVVLGAAELRFIAPVEVGATVRIEARVEAEKGRKRTVAVVCKVGHQTVLSGTLTTFVLDQHVLDR